MDHALVGAAVTEEGDDDAVGLAKLVGEGGAGADGHTRGHDAVGAQDVEIEGGDVHGATETATVARLPPHELGHHEVELGSLGDAVAMPPVIADDGVGVGQIGAGARGHRFLPDIAMGGALDVAGVEELHRLLVEAADADHDLIQALERLDIEGHDRSPVTP